MTSIRQGRHETQESWYRRSKSKCDTLEVAKLGYFDIEHVTGYVNCNATVAEIVSAKEELEVVYSLQISNHQRHNG